MFEFSFNLLEMDCKSPVHNVSRHGSRGPKPAPPPKPIRPGASTKHKGSPPALPRSSPVARVKPMKHDSLDIPNAQIASTPGKTPPPLPCTPPKGSPTKLSPKLPLKFPLKPPCKPTNASTVPDVNIDVLPSLGPAQVAESSPKGSPNISRKPPWKSPPIEVEAKSDDLDSSTGTTDVDKSHIKQQKNTPSPVRPAAPRPVPRKRSTPTLSTESSAQEAESEDITSPKSPIQPTIPKQRGLELNKPGETPLQKSMSEEEEPTLNESVSAPSRTAERMGDFSLKLAGLLGQGPKNIGKQQENDSGDKLNTDPSSQDNSCENDIVYTEVICEAVGNNQTNTEFKIPPRKKRNRKSRDSSPASPNTQRGLENQEVDKDNNSCTIKAQSMDISELDQNANDVNQVLERFSSCSPTPDVVDQSNVNVVNTEGQTSSQVKKLAMGFANLVAKGLQQQLSMKTRPSVSPKPRSRNNSSDVSPKPRSRNNSSDEGHITPDVEEEKMLSKATSFILTPPATPESISINAGEKPHSPIPKIKLPMLPPKLPAKPIESMKKDSRSSSDGSNASQSCDDLEGKDVTSGNSTSNMLTTSEDVIVKEPPPPLPVRTAPKMKKESAIDEMASFQTPDHTSSSEGKKKKRDKRPLPPLPSAEDETIACSPSIKAHTPHPKNRPLPPVPDDSGVLRPVRKAPGKPLGRKRSKSSPGPVKLIMEEFRPRSQDVLDTKKWSDDDEMKFLELKKQASLKKTDDRSDVSLEQQSSRDRKPVFNTPPPPPVEGDMINRGSQTPVDLVAKFDFDIPADVIHEEEEQQGSEGLSSRLSHWSDEGGTKGEGLVGAFPTTPDVAGHLCKPCRPAPPPPPPKPKSFDEANDNGHCDEQGYMTPKQRDSLCENSEEYSYVSNEYFPDEEQKQRCESTDSSQHIYEFVDTSQKENVRVMSVASGDIDDTYAVPGEVLDGDVIMRKASTTSSHMYQIVDPPQAPPRPKRQTIRQKSLDLLSFIVPIDADAHTDMTELVNQGASDDEYIYPVVTEPMLESQNIECESTYDISNIRISQDWTEPSGENDDYILPGAQLVESDTTYDISSTPINSPVKVQFFDKEAHSSSDLPQRHHSMASSTSSDNHDYFDMTGVSSRTSSYRHTYHEEMSLTGTLKVPSLTASQEELWKESQSYYSDTESEEETGDDDDDKPKKPKVFYIAREIMTSEEVFVDVLKLLNVDFRKAVSQTTEQVGRPIIPSGVLNQILHYLPQLESFNEEFLQDMHKRVDNWEEDPRIADIFVRKGPFLRLYISYIKEYDHMISMFDEACKKYPVFHDLVKDFETSERCASLALRHYMLKPIQRIPQYKLLLQDYLNHLSEHSLDYKDSRLALEIVSEIATHANESMREGDNFQKLLEVQNSLQGNFEVVKPGRTLLKMGILNKLSRKEAQPRMLFLFNDVLLYTTPLATAKEYKLNHVLSLVGMKACKPAFEEFQNEFSVISIQRSFTISANTPRERDEWLLQLTRAIDDNAVKRSTFEQAKTNPESIVVVDKNFQLGLQAPVWVPDARVTMCMLCTSEFTVTWRRHHCRACGRVICGACSDYKAPLTYLKGKSSRVCSECFEKISEQQGTSATANDEQMSPITEGEEDGRRPRRMSESFRKSTKWVNRLHIKRPSVLKEVQANDAGSDMSGYMKVLRGKKWKKRWFVIKDKVLYTYKASEDAAASRSAPLLGYEIKTFSEADTNDSYLSKYFENVEPSLVFQVSHKGTDPIVFRTESSSTKDKWIQAITDATVA